MFLSARNLRTTESEVQADQQIKDDLSLAVPDVGESEVSPAAEDVSPEIRGTFNLRWNTNLQGLAYIVGWIAWKNIENYPSLGQKSC